MRPEDDWAVFAHVANLLAGHHVKAMGRGPLGANLWGNLGNRVALRHHPFITGMVVADLGPVQWVGRGEDGVVLVAPTANTVCVGSPAHRDALAALE